jgi:DNA-binding XRE family transcriptional regulator
LRNTGSFEPHCNPSPPGPARERRLRTLVLPFCHLTFRAKKPVSREKYPDICRTWGDYIKVRRLDLKLTKRQLSLKLNVSDITIYLWEKNRVKPSLAQIPKIIEFLGRDPFEKKAENSGTKIKEYRRVHGLTQKKLAELLAIDQTTLAAWERGEHQPTKRLFRKLTSVFAPFSPFLSKDEE